MTILYNDSLYPGKAKKYVGLTIGQILLIHKNPIRFIKAFNVAYNNFCISDEVFVDTSQYVTS